jgi:hypothetical protein
MLVRDYNTQQTAAYKKENEKTRILLWLPYEVIRLKVSISVLRVTFHADNFMSPRYSILPTKAGNRYIFNENGNSQFPSLKSQDPILHVSVMPFPTSPRSKSQSQLPKRARMLVPKFIQEVYALFFGFGFCFIFVRHSLFEARS